MSDTRTAELKYQAARAFFVGRGTSFAAWCKSVGVSPQNARKAMLGNWSGPRAQRLVERILSETGQLK